MTIRNLLSSFLTLFIIAFALPCAAQTKAESIDELLTQYKEYGKFNGSILVAEEGKIIFKKGYGFANLEWDIPNDVDTKFRIASISKQFTAMLIVQLAAENKLDLHAPISTYLPHYPQPNGDAITIHHLLTHTSGIPEFDAFMDYYTIERKHFRPQELMDLFADQPLEFTPGDHFNYVNTGYIVLGAIIEKLAGMRYEAALQQKIFTPLGMTNTGYDHHQTILKNRATGYSHSYARISLYNSNFIDMSVPYAAGSMYSTVEDLFLWDQALYTEKLLPKKYLDLLFEKYVPASGRHYGYGIFLGEMNIGNTNKTVKTNSHGGGINGFNTLITRFPKNKAVVILLNNTERAPLFQITTSINGILYNEDFDLPKQSLAKALSQKLDSLTIDDALDFYKDAKKSGQYYIDEEEMNHFGYTFFQAEKFIKAAFIFKLNVEAFPESFNVFDSYAEALLALGYKKQAAKNYEKSLRLNPENKNAQMMLDYLNADD